MVSGLGNLVMTPPVVVGGPGARWNWETPYVPDYSDSISIIKCGSQSASSIRKSLAKEELGVGWDMLAGSSPESLPSPNKVEGEAIMTDRRLVSLGLVRLLSSPFGTAGSSIGFSLASASGFTKPAVLWSTPASLRIRQPFGALTPRGLTGTSWDG